MYKFNYESHENCSFMPGVYRNGNMAIEIWSETEGPICKVTSNTDFKLPEGYIAVKNYSECKDMPEFLKRLGIIADRPALHMPSGHVLLPVYKITEKGQEILEF